MTFRIRVGALMALWVGLGTAGAAETTRLRFVVFGASAGATAARQRLLAEMARRRPALAVHAGGMVADGRRAEAWDRLEADLRPLREVCLFYPCDGAADGARLFGGRFRLPGDGGEEPRTWYAFDRRGVRFVVLDSRRPARPAPDRQTAWLAARLAEARGRPIFVFFHLPVFSVAWGDFAPGARQVWHPLFARHGVWAVFSGGHAIYYRTRQDGVTYVVTGGGGAALDPVRARRKMLLTDVAGSFHHFIEVAVEGEGARARVVGPEGRTRDEFALPK